MSTEHEKYKVRKDLMSTMALETDVGKVTSGIVPGVKSHSFFITTTKAMLKRPIVYLYGCGFGG